MKQCENCMELFEEDDMTKCPSCDAEICVECLHDSCPICDYFLDNE